MTEQEKKPPMIDRRDLASIVFRDWRENARSTFDVAAGYGRWLIGSLVLIHGGALLGMFSFLDSAADKPDLLAGYRWPIWSFVLGLVLALLSGFGAWLNWSMHAANYLNEASHEMLWDPDKWLDEAVFKKGLPITHWLSVGSGLASGFLILVATFLLLHGKQFSAWWISAA